MSLFSRKRDSGVQSFVLKLVNNHCAGVKAAIEGPRNDSRVTVVVPIMVVPIEGGEPQAGQAFTTVTKDFSNTGVAIVVERAPKFAEAFLGLRLGGDTTFLRAKVKHVRPIGGGLFQLGLQMLDVVVTPDYPELESLSL
ncbi:MAG: PilZ domain-containing protein [Planctomycetaceae bacterium]|nr:PilZ domain-containing protein [Planctomycetaceae bacterium]